jgi:hypothetical protein
MKRHKIDILRETYEAPAGMQRLLELAGGRNRFGDPFYRLVWGWNRLEWIGGRITDLDDAGKTIREVIELRQEPRYQSVLFNPNRWYIERWYPPEWYGSRRSWEVKTIEIEDGRSIPALGPYPERGDYEHFYTVEGPDGGFRQLTWPRAAWLASIVYTSERAYWQRQLEPGDALSKKRAGIAAEKRAERKQHREILDSTIDAFDYNPFVSFAGRDGKAAAS